MDIVIAIRTAKRIETIENQTLKFVKDLGFPIYIFCPEDEIKEYRKKFKDYKIKDGGNQGTHLCNQKIVDCFKEGQKIIQMDDDVKAFLEWDGEKFVEADLKHYIQEGFRLCEENNFKLFGFYPVKNGFFMKGQDTYSKGLQFIMGGIHGFINDKELRTQDNYRDDYERSILNYIKYGGCIRFNYVKVDNIIYVNKGGQAKLRTIEKMEKSCNYMVSTYPNYCRMKKCKSPYPEISIKIKRYDISYHLLCNLRLINWIKNTDRPNVSGVDEERTREYNERGDPRKIGNPCFSYTFGFIRPRRAKLGTHQLTKVSKKYPLVYNLLKAYINEIAPDFKYTSITANKNIVCKKHTDKNNQTDSLAIALGDFTGGYLYVNDVKHDIRYKPLIFNGRHEHYSTDFEGERYSLIFYNL